MRETLNISATVGDRSPKQHTWSGNHCHMLNIFRMWCRRARLVPKFQICVGKEITPMDFQLHIIKVKLLCSGFSRLAAATSVLQFPPLVSHAAAPKPKCDENPRAHLCLAQYCHRHWSGKHANERINQEVIMLGLPFLLQACFDSKIRYHT